MLLYNQSFICPILLIFTKIYFYFIPPDMIFPFFWISHSVQSQTETAEEIGLFSRIFGSIAEAYNKNYEILTQDTTPPIQNLEVSESPAFWDFIGRFSPYFFNFTKNLDSHIYKTYTEKGIWKNHSELPIISFIFDFRLLPLFCGIFIIGMMTVKNRATANSKLAVFYFFFLLKILSFSILSLFSYDLFFTCSSLFVGSFTLHLYIFLIEICMAIGFYIHLRMMKNRVGVNPSRSIRDAIDTVSYAVSFIQKYPQIYQFGIIFGQNSNILIIKGIFAGLFTIFTLMSSYTLIVTWGFHIFFEFISIYIGPYYKLIFLAVYYPRLDIWSPIINELHEFLIMLVGKGLGGVLLGFVKGMIIPKIVLFQMMGILKILKFVERVLLSSLRMRGGYERFKKKEEPEKNSNLAVIFRNKEKYLKESPYHEEHTI